MGFLKRFGKARLMATATLITLLAVLTSTLVPEVMSEFDKDFSDGECEECHTGFEPYTIQVDSPTEVPVGQEFEFGLLITNPWSHDLRHLRLIVDLSDSPGLDSPDGVELPDIDTSDVFNAGPGFTGNFQYLINGDIGHASFDLEWDRPLLYTGSMDMTLTGPGGSVWNMDNSNAITLSTQDVENEGYGIYEIQVEHNSIIRSTTATLTSVIDFTGRSAIIEQQIDRVGPGESATISVPLTSNSRGINNITYYFEATAMYDHSGNGVDEDVYTSDGTQTLVVGDDYSYSKPEAKISVSTSMWILGRVLGFVTVILFIASFLSGGTIKRLKIWIDKRMKNRHRWHCVISFASMVSVVVHLAVLYLGFYSGTWKGLLSGSIPLFLMVIVGITGWKKDKIVEMSSEKTWRRVHFWLSILAVLLIVIHAIAEGTDLAFLRWW